MVRDLKQKYKPKIYLKSVNKLVKIHDGKLESSHVVRAFTPYYVRRDVLSAVESPTIDDVKRRKGITTGTGTAT